MNLGDWLRSINRRRNRWRRERRIKYKTWIDRYESVYIDRLKLESVDNDGPLISVIMPVYKPNIEYLRQAIQSVRDQIYQNWELCICDDFSNDLLVRDFLNESTSSDQRIKVCYRSQNGHISAASNDAVKIARGDFLALLDQDDLLSQHALLMVSRAVNEDQNVKMLYSDEDKFNNFGVRYAPYFKSDWNVYLFRSHNMVSHLGVYKRDLFLSVGGFRVGLEGSQDYDLALRCAEILEPGEIRHIPQVLYHWRVHSESTASGLDAKPYASLAAIKAISEHLERQQIAANVNCNGASGYTVHYHPAPVDRPVVTVFVNDLQGTIEDCSRQVKELVESTHYPISRVLFYCCSALWEFKLYQGQCSLEEVEVKGIEGGKNGVNALLTRNYQDGELVCSLAGVSHVDESWLTELVGLLGQKDVVIVGGKLIDEEGKLVHSGYAIGGGRGFISPNTKDSKHGYAGKAACVQEVSAVSSACMIVQADLFMRLNGFARDLFSVFGDIDFCLRASDYGKIVWTPNACFKVGSGSFSTVPSKKMLKAFKRRWSQDRDAYFNEHISMEHGYFCLDWRRSLKLLDAES